MTPEFPPLFTGLATAAEPFDIACAQAAEGCDAGLVVHQIAADRLRAAIVFSPEMPLADAVAMMPVCGLGFRDALGVLGPPEVAVHLDWAGGLRVNGASCGHLRMAASTMTPDREPDWLVVGLDLTFWPDSDDPGATPDRTSLYAEGCGEIDPVQLLEAWVRHTLIQINRLLDGERAGLHSDWRALAHGHEKDMRMVGKTGIFLGVDARFGMLLRDGEATHLIPLTHVLEDRR